VAGEGKLSHAKRNFSSLSSNLSRVEYLPEASRLGLPDYTSKRMDPRLANCRDRRPGTNLDRLPRTGLRLPRETV